MKTLIKLLLTAIAVVVLSWIMPGVYVESPFTALVFAAVLALLRLIVKPVLILLTLPITVVTFGLFLLVISAFMIMMAGYLVPGFGVDSFWYALLFGVLLSIFQSLLFTFLPSEGRAD